MHRKTNISKCIYILAYVIANAILSNAQIATNKTDQSVAVQTEKIINVHDVSRTTTATIPSSSTVGFMNERSTENGNDDGDMNESSTVMPTKSIDDGTALIVDMINAEVAERNAGNNTVTDQMKSFPQDFDFNLDDLEDLNYHRKETSDVDDAEDDVTDGTLSGTSRFEEFTLDDVTSTNDGRRKGTDDNQEENVYRVAKSKSKPIANAAVIRNSRTSMYRPWTNGSVTSFQMLTEMYDQYRWNINNIMGNVSNKCGLDMQIYLNALNNEVEWALKGKLFNLICFNFSDCVSIRAYNIYPKTRRFAASYARVSFTLVIQKSAEQFF